MPVRLICEVPALRTLEAPKTVLVPDAVTVEALSVKIAFAEDAVVRTVQLTA